MKCHGFKGGIGSSSRLIKIGDKTYTLGVLVNSNFGASNGRDLIFKGRPLGDLIKNYKLKQEEDKGNITTGDMEGKNVRKGIFKEVRVGFLNGLIIGVVSFVFIFLFLLLRKQEIVSGDGFVIYDIIKVSSIIATSMLVAMTISSLTGSLFPIILNKIHIDPAVASGPFITTLNDVLAVFLYYGLAYLAFILFL